MGETEEQKTNDERTRRQFDDEFKKDAVRLLESGNLTVRQVAEVLVSRRQPSRTGWTNPPRRGERRG